MPFLKASALGCGNRVSSISVFFCCVCSAKGRRSQGDFQEENFSPRKSTRTCAENEQSTLETFR